MGLILPPEIAERTKYLRCMVPGCGKKFPIDQDPQFVRHVKACSKRNEGLMEEIVAENQSDNFRAPADPEFFAHIRKGGN